MTAPDAPGRRVRKRRQTQDHLAKTAARLFEVHGFDEVTMEQIAIDADVAKGTLYNYFPVKEAVLAHWIHLQLASDMAHLSADMDPNAGFEDAIDRILDASADWCERHRIYLLPYLRFRFMEIEIATPKSNDADADAGDMIGAFEWLIRKSQQAGRLCSDLGAEHLATMFHHLYLAALLRWLNVPNLVLREEFAAAVRIFVEGTARRASKSTMHKG
jgi:TetR/AcrR family transcriptional regulator, regulator of autoinduction and epiphytic fitness